MLSNQLLTIWPKKIRRSAESSAATLLPKVGGVLPNHVWEEIWVDFWEEWEEIWEEVLGGFILFRLWAINTLSKVVNFIPIEILCFVHKNILIPNFCLKNIFFILGTFY